MKEFESLTREIVSLIKIWEPKLSTIPEIILINRKNDQNRTIKQILGHLIDSTSNNTHRVVHLQYQKSPFEFPNYATFGNNDRWIAIQNYQNEEWKTMIQLWKSSLLHYCHVVENIDTSKLENEWIAGPDRRITLSSLLMLFLDHFKLHLSEIDALIERDNLDNPDKY
jgi:predicted MPP superfamily phosphohydrolase